MKVLDTTVVIDHLRGHRAAARLFGELAADEEEVVLASELTRFELVAGVRPDEVASLEDVSTLVDWVPVTEAIARRGGDLARRYRPSHGAIDDIDYLVAATALELDADILTVNVRHFPMFEGLTAPY